MFAKGSFGSLTQLKVEAVDFHETLTLTNTPSLKRLIFKHCKYPQLRTVSKYHIFGTPRARMWRRRFLSWFRSKGLEYLFINFLQSVLRTDNRQADLARAIILHRDTLRTLDLIQSESPTNGTMWEYAVVKVIRRCQNLVRLSLPLVYNKPPSYYRYLAGRFPDLVSLTVYDIGLKICYSCWTPGIVLQLFPAASKLGFVSFNCARSALIGYDDNFERRFVRKDLEKSALRGFIEIE